VLQTGLGHLGVNPISFGHLPKIVFPNARIYPTINA